MLRRLLLAGVLGVLVAVLGPASSAFAHAYLTGSTPGDGSSTGAAPRTLTLHFSESVTLAATHIDVVDDAGRHYRPTHLRIRAGEDTEEPSSVTADLPALPHGAYRVSWETLSSDDLHRTSGVFVFGVARPVHAAPFREARPGALEVALRWTLFAGLAGAVGGLVVMLRRRSSMLPAGTIRRLRVVAAGGAVLGSAAASALLVDQVTASGQSWAAVVTGPYGARWGLRAVGLLGLVAAALAAGKGSRRRRGVAACLGAVATGVGSALLGHSEAVAGGPTAITADALHLLAAALWAGLLLVGAVVCLPRADAARAVARDVLRGFALPAAAAVGVLVASGLYLTSHLVGSVDAALRTIYGNALLIKVGLLLVAGAFGLAHNRHLHARTTAGPAPRRTVWWEAGVLLVALGAAAVLTSGQPAREARFVSAPRPATVPLQDQRVADLQETLRIGPNHVGPAVALIDVVDTRRPAPAVTTGVLVRVGDSAPVRATRVQSSVRWSARVQLPSDGTVPVEIVVERSGVAAVRHTFRWVVAPTAMATVAPIVSTAPLGPTLRGLAWTLAGLLTGGWLLVAARRRRDTASGSAGRTRTTAAEPDGAREPALSGQPD